MEVWRTGEVADRCDTVDSRFPVRAVELEDDEIDDSLVDE